MQLLWAIFFWTTFVGNLSLRVSELEVCSPRVPEGFDGYRIVHISDLHTNSDHAGRYERMVKRVGKARADLIVNTGDLVTISHEELKPEMIEIYSGLMAPDGVWSVWGNHDLGFYIHGADSVALTENFERMRQKVARMGWRTLSDESVYIRRGRSDGGSDSILLTGLDFPHDGMHRGHNTMLAGVDIDAAFEGVEGRPFNVVMAHTPQMWRRVTERGRGDVTMSGHTHAMQLKALGWSPAQYLYEHWSGRHEDEEKNVLYVNDGIGYVGIPLRVGARPEITIYTLKRCE